MMFQAYALFPHLNVAQKPAAAGKPGPTPVEVKSGWDRYKDGRVKGVKFISKTNDVVVMVSG